MAQLRQDYRLFAERGAEVIAIGPEDQQAFARWWRDHEMPFVGLADPDHTVADLYGQEVVPAKLGRLPAQFVIDKRGRIRYQHYSSAMWDIPSNKEILTLLEQLNQEEKQS